MLLWLTVLDAASTLPQGLRDEASPRVGNRKGTAYLCCDAVQSHVA